MNWYEIKNKNDKAEIWLYEIIGKDFWTDEGMTAKDFQKELSEIKAEKIDLHINSPGGSVFDGNTIYNLLKSHKAKITTYIDGIAASIASVIALAGDKIYMAQNGLFMLHQPFAFTMGNEDDHEKTLEILRKVGGSIATTYMKKTDKEESEILDMMKVETWLNADEALEAGFVDEISDKVDMAACAQFAPLMDKLGFKNIPQKIAPKNQSLSAKDAERALRDVGFSVKASKTIVSKGFSDDLRDVDQSGNDLQESEPLRDVEEPKPAETNDRVETLLTKAEILAPSTQKKGVL